MRPDFRAPMFAIAGALLGLILLLATLQYRWLGQISGAERERMTANLNTRAAAFAQDFDRELTRAYLLFQLDPMQQDRGAAAGIGTRYDRWQATARFPRMIKDVYLVPSPQAVDEAGRLQRFNGATRFLEPVDWPAALTEIRAQLHKPTPPGAASPAGIVMRSLVSTVWPSVPALVIPTPVMMVSHVTGAAGATLSSVSMSPELRYTVLLLDADYIRREMLPALAQQHFQGTGDGFDYQLAVVPTADGGLVYHSVPLFNPKAESPADARVELFRVRVQDFEPLVNEVSRFATMFTASVPHGGVQGRAFIRQSITSPNASVSIRTQGAPLFVLESGRSSGPQQSSDKLFAGAAAATAAAVARAGAPAPHWRLLVKHPSGSLEQAVNSVRRRNLIVSTSILGVLGVSVGFLVLSTRRAQDLARQQLEFVATVSHELRTPLAVIRSAADNLADGVVNDEARIRQYGQLVRREGLRLTDLVEQILEFAGLQSGQRTMTARPVAMAAVLGDVVAALESSAGQAGITIELSIADNLPLVTGDEAALRRVFQNLIGNAIKYGAGARTSVASEPRERRGAFGVPAPRPGSGRPEHESKGASERAGGSGPPPPRSGFGEVSQKRASTDGRAKADGAKPPGRDWIGVRALAAGGRLEVSVTDRGIGIPAAEQAKIFDPFYRAPDVVAAQIQGAGLGLSLVKRIVEAHAGQVTLKSAPGQGSTFTVTLPTARGDVAEGHDEVSQAAPQPL